MSDHEVGRDARKQEAPDSLRRRVAHCFRSYGAIVIDGRLPEWRLISATPNPAAELTAPQSDDEVAKTVGK